MHRKEYLATALIIVFVAIFSFMGGIVVAKSANEKSNSNINTVTITTANSNEINEKININRANKETLKMLSGIGETKAVAILDNRPYKSIYEILELPEIGETAFNNIKELIICD